jgi:phospholipase C
MKRTKVAFGACLTLLAGTALSTVALAVPQRPAGAPIQHVVIVVQEARSFDNLFCGYPGANGTCSGPQISLAANCRLSDTYEEFRRDVHDQGNFGRERAHCPGIARPAYGFAPKSETEPYWSLAQQYVLGDTMFSSTGNPTFEAHQYLVAAQAARAKDEPFGMAPADGCVYREQVRRFGGQPEPACFSYATLGGELDAAKLSWAYYRAGAGGDVAPWDAYGWIAGSASGSEYGSHVIAPSAQFLTDVAGGKLAAVTWVTPELVDSDLSGTLSATGPQWVAAVVNAVGASPFWGTTAIFVTWSGFGGWADHVPPPAVDGSGLGFRVPLLIVSPYAKRGLISHDQYEFGSVLKFVEGSYGLAPLAASDRRANSPAVSAFDFNQKPRKFVPIH